MGSNVIGGFPSPWLRGSNRSSLEEITMVSQFTRQG